MPTNYLRPLLVSAALLAASPLLADEPQRLLEEVTVIGAVHGSDSLGIADIDVAGDDSLADMPVVYEDTISR